MNFQIVILFFVTAVIEKGLAGECGTTTSWQDGDTAKILYTPNPRYVRNQRTWIHSNSQNSPVVVFDIRGTASPSPRYIEQFSADGTYSLFIHSVTTYDSGVYAVRCWFDGGLAFYSETTRLHVHIDITTATNITINDLSTTSTSNSPSVRPSVEYSTSIKYKGSVDRKTEHESTEVEFQTLSQPIDERTQMLDDNSANDNTENHSTNDMTMIIGMVIGIAVGIVVTLAVVLVILLICKRRKSPNSVKINNTENHPMKDMTIARTIASARNENIANSGYVSLHPTTRSINEREYADLMTSQPH